MAVIKTISATIAVSAPVESVFEAVTDWEFQQNWILATRVWGVGENSHRIGGKLEAYTGFGKIGFLDTMTITKWQPPYVCEVTHTGTVVKGSGLFEVSEKRGQTYFTWSEIAEIPFGKIGSLGWPIIKPFIWLSLKLSLVRFRKAFNARKHI